MSEMHLGEVQLSQPEWLVRVSSMHRRTEDPEHRARCGHLYSPMEEPPLDQDEPAKLDLF